MQSYSMDLAHFYKVGLPWLSEQIKAHSRMAEITTPEGVPWDFRLWLIWAARLGFVTIWPEEPTLGFVARPVNLFHVEHWQEIDPGDLLYVYDRQGEVIWFDFLWAPGQYNLIYEWLEATQAKYVGWQHKTTLKAHLKLISKLPKQVS